MEYVANYKTNLFVRAHIFHLISVFSRMQIISHDEDKAHKI